MSALGEALGAVVEHGVCRGETLGAILLDRADGEARIRYYARHGRDPKVRAAASLVAAAVVEHEPWGDLADRLHLAVLELTRGSA